MVSVLFLFLVSLGLYAFKTLESPAVMLLRVQTVPSWK